MPFTQMVSYRSSQQLFGCTDTMRPSRTVHASGHMPPQCDWWYVYAVYSSPESAWAGTNHSSDVAIAPAAPNSARPAPRPRFP